MTTTAYKNVGRAPADLHDGRILQPGGERKLSAAEAALPHNARLIDAGVLVVAQHAHKAAAKASATTKKESDQ